MVKRHDKKADGMYHIGKNKYALLEGSRAQVMHGTAYKTSGDLKKGDLMMKHGRVLSKKKSQLAKTQKHLKGFLQPKGSGKFGSYKKKRHTKKRTHRKRK
jgi:hypothetical protein